jgi:hypothetical protein
LEFRVIDKECFERRNNIILSMKEFREIKNERNEVLILSIKFLDI